MATQAIQLDPNTFSMESRDFEAGLRRRICGAGRSGAGRGGSVPGVSLRIEFAGTAGRNLLFLGPTGLDRACTFIMLALLILLSPVVILRTPTDIFPNINIPVITVAWQYIGLNPEEVEGRLTTVYERVSQ